MSKFFLVFLSIINLHYCFSQNRQHQMNRIDDILLNEIDCKNTPAVQYLIFNQDSIIYSKQLGLSDIENKISIHKDSRFNTFSITKTFTALAILQLAEQGKLDIDHSASEYLPSFPYPAEITIKQLLTHSAGIPNPIPLNWIHLNTAHLNFDRNAFFDLIFKNNNKTKSQPNEKFAYSNLGYILLGQIIEHLSRISYEAYIETNIIKKMGLENELNFELDSNQARGYHKKWSFTNFVLGFLIDKSTFMNQSIKGWKPFKSYYVNGASYGGLIGTPHSLMVYIQTLLQANNTLITDEYKSLLFTENNSTRMCLSWFKGKLNGTDYYTHAGGGGGYYCEIRIYPALGIGSVIMFNRTGMKDERFLDQLDKHIINSKRL